MNEIREVHHYDETSPSLNGWMIVLAVLVLGVIGFTLALWQPWAAPTSTTIIRENQPATPPSSTTVINPPSTVVNPPSTVVVPPARTDVHINENSDQTRGTTTGSENNETTGGDTTTGKTDNSGTTGG